MGTTKRVRLRVMAAAIGVGAAVMTGQGLATAEPDASDHSSPSASDRSTPDASDRSTPSASDRSTPDATDRSTPSDSASTGSTGGMTGSVSTSDRSTPDATDRSTPNDSPSTGSTGGMTGSVSTSDRSTPAADTSDSSPAADTTSDESATAITDPAPQPVPDPPAPAAPAEVAVADEQPSPSLIPPAAEADSPAVTAPPETADATAKVSRSTATTPDVDSANTPTAAPDGTPARLASTGAATTTEQATDTEITEQSTADAPMTMMRIGSTESAPEGTITTALTVPITPQAPLIVATGFLLWLGLPIGGSGGTAPVAPPPAWALLAFVRRFTEDTLFNSTPIATAPPTVNTGQDAETGAITGTINVADANNDRLVYTVAQGAKGTAVVNPDGTFTYTPNAATLASGGTDTFTVGVSDATSFHIHPVIDSTGAVHFENLFGGGHTTTVPVTVTVAPGANQAPTLAVASGQADPQTGVRVYTATTTDPNGDTVTTSATQGAHGNVANNGDGTFTYTPDAAYYAAQEGAGSDEFTVTANDGRGSTVTKPVTVDIDLTNVVIDTVDVGNNPFNVAITPDGSRAYVTNIGSGSVSVIDTSTNTVVTTIDFGDAAPIDVAITPSGDRAYVTSSTQGAEPGTFIGTVSVIDTATNTVVDTIDLGADAAWGVAISPDGTRAYVTSFQQGADPDNFTGTVTVIDTSTNTIVGTIPVNDSITDIAVSPDSSRAYVVNASGDSLTVIDTTTNTIVTTLDFGDFPIGDAAHAGVAVSPDGTRVYVTSLTPDAGTSYTGTIRVIDTATNTNIANIPLGAVNEQLPVGVAFTPDGSQAYVVNLSGGSVTVIDTTTNTVTATIPVGDIPFGLAISPDGTRAYTTNYADGTVSVIKIAPTTPPTPITALTSIQTLTNTTQLTTLAPPTAPPAAFDLSALVSSTATYVAQWVAVGQSILTTIQTQYGTIGSPPLPPVSEPPTIITFVQNFITNTLFNSAPTAAPEINPGQDVETGQITGTITTFDANNDRLVYAVTQAPTKGTAIVNPDGTFTYTPNAATLEAGGTDTFTVTVSDATSFHTHPVIDSNGYLNLANIFGGGHTTQVPITVTVAAADQAKVIATVDVGDGPTGVAVSPDGTHTYVTNTRDNTISVRDNTTGTVTTVTVGTSPSGVAVSPDGTRAYVTNADDGTVSIIDTTTNTVVGNPITVGTNPTGVAVTPDGTHVYVTNTDDGTVSIIDTATHDVTTVDVGAQPAQVAFSPDGTRAYVTNTGDNTVSVIDTTTIAAAVQPMQMMFSRSAFASEESATFSALGASTDTPITVGNGPTGVAVSPDGSRVYVTNAGDGTVSVIDTTTNTVINTITVGEGPTNVAVSPDGTHVYVTNTDDGTISIVDTTTNTVTSTIGVGDGPVGIAFSPDGTRAYVTNFDDGTISVIDVPPSTPPANQAPSLQVVAGQPNSQTGAVDYTAITSDPNGDAVTVSVTDGPDHGVLIDNGDGTYTYTPDPDYAHAVAAGGPNTDSFTLVATDPYGAMTSATPAVVISPQNSDPNLQVLATGRNADTGAVVYAVATTDTDGDTTTVMTTPPAHGTVVDNGDGTYTYTPDAAYFEAEPGLDTDSFTVVAVDGHGGIDTARITVTVDAALDHTVIATVPVGSSPYDATVSPDGTRIYVTSAGDGTITIIDTTTNTAIGAPINVGTYPYSAAVSPDGTHVYVTNSGDGTVSVIDTTTNTVTPITVGAAPVDVAISPDGTRAYVTNADDDTVSVIDTTTTNTVIDTISVAADSDPYGVAVSPDGSHVYVTNLTGNTVTVISTTTNTVTDTVNVGTNPYDVAISPDGSHVYVTNVTDGTLSVIDTTTNTVTDTVDVGAYPYSVEISPDGTRAYVTNFGDDTVSVVDTATNTVTRTISVGDAPLGVTVSPDGTRVYVTNTNDYTVSVIYIAPNRAPTFEVVAGQPNAQTAAVDYTVTTSDRDNDAVTVSLTQPAHGVVVDNGDSTYTYTPDDDYFDAHPDENTDSFTIAATDGHGGIASETVSVDVAPRMPFTDVEPEINTPNTTTGAVTGSVAVTDPEGDTLAYTLTAPPSKGTVALDNATGEFSYTPDPDARYAAGATTDDDTDTFTVTASDSTGDEFAMAVTVPVTPSDALTIGTANHSVFPTPDGTHAVVVGPHTDPATGQTVTTAHIVDTTTGTTTSPVPIMGTFQSATSASDGEHIYLLSDYTDESTGTHFTRVVILDTATGAPSEPIDIAGRPHALVVTSDGERAYLVTYANLAGDPIGVTMIDAETGVAAETIFVDGQFRQLVANENGKAYVATISYGAGGVQSAHLYGFDESTQSSDVTYTGQYIDKIIVTADGTAYVTTGEFGVATTNLRVIDGTTGATTTTTLAGNSWEVSVSPDGEQTYVVTRQDLGAGQYTSTAIVVNNSDNTQSDPIYLDGSLVGVYFTPDGDHAIIAAVQTNQQTGEDTTTFTVVDGATGEHTEIAPIAGTLSSVVFTPDSDHAFVATVVRGPLIIGQPSQDKGWLTVVDTTTGTNTTPVELDGSINNLTVAPDGEHAYFVVGAFVLGGGVETRESAVIDLAGTIEELETPGALLIPIRVTQIGDDEYLYATNIDKETGNQEYVIIRHPGDIFAPVIETPFTEVEPEIDRPNTSTGTVTGSVAVIDAEGDTVTYTLTTAPTVGTVALDSATGEFTYTPNANAFAVGAITDYDTDTFVVTANDGAGTELAMTVTLPVISANTLVLGSGGSGNPVFTPDSSHVLLVEVGTHPGAGPVTTVTVFETATGQAAEPVHVDGYIHRTVFNANGDQAYVVTFDSSTGVPVTRVAIIDTTTGTSSTPLDIDGTPGDIVVTPDGGHVYVTTSATFGSSSSAVTVIDTATGTATTVPITGSLGEVGITPDGRAYVMTTNGPGTTVYSIDESAQTTQVTVTGTPNDLVVRADNTAIVISSEFDSTTNTTTFFVTIFDGATGNHSPVDVTGSPDNVAVSPDGTKSYLTTTQTDSVTGLVSTTVTTIDNTTGTDTGTLVEADGEFDRLVFTPDGNHAYLVTVSNRYTPTAITTVTVIDTTTGSHTPSATATGSPFGVVFTPDSQHAFIATYEFDTGAGITRLTVVETATGAASPATRTFVGQPQAFAVSPSDRVYFNVSKNPNVIGGGLVVDEVLISVDVDGIVTTYQTPGIRLHPAQAILIGDDEYLYALQVDAATLQQEYVLIRNPAMRFALAEEPSSPVANQA